MTEKVRSLEEIIKSEGDPHTKRLLELMKRWWEPPRGFNVPGRNYLGVEGGFYYREDLYPLMVGGYKPGMAADVRERLVQTSKTIYEAMLLCDDGNLLFETMWKGPITGIDR